MFFYRKTRPKIDLDANQDENSSGLYKTYQVYQWPVCSFWKGLDTSGDWIPPIFYGDWIPPESAPLHGFCGYDSVGHLRKKRNNLRRIRKVWWRASISNLLLRVVTGSKWHLSSIKIFHEIPGGFPVANFHQIDSGWGWSITWVFVCGYLPNVPNVNDVNLNMNGDHGDPKVKNEEIVLQYLTGHN